MGEVHITNIQVTPSMFKTLRTQTEAPCHGCIARGLYRATGMYRITRNGRKFSTKYKDTVDQKIQLVCYNDLSGTQSE